MMMMMMTTTTTIAAPAVGLVVVAAAAMMITPPSNNPITCLNKYLEHLKDEDQGSNLAVHQEETAKLMLVRLQQFEPPHKAVPALVSTDSADLYRRGQ